MNRLDAFMATTLCNKPAAWSERLKNSLNELRTGVDPDQLAAHVFRFPGERLDDSATYIDSGCVRAKRSSYDPARWDVSRVPGASTFGKVI